MHDHKNANMRGFHGNLLGQDCLFYSFLLFCHYIINNLVDKLKIHKEQ